MQYPKDNRPNAMIMAAMVVLLFVFMIVLFIRFDLQSK
jgi:hypothetical protein